MSNSFVLSCILFILHHFVSASVLPPYLYPFPNLVIPKFSTGLSCIAPSGGLGICRSLTDCVQFGGVADGPCPIATTGVCCKPQIKCNGILDTGYGSFSNREFPNTSANSGICSLTVRIAADVVGVKLTFQEFILSPPSEESGLCENDKFWIEGPTSSKFPKAICGENSGQHFYLEVNSESSLDLKLIAKHSEINFNRKWSIVINLVKANDQQKPPSGCLQYYSNYNGHISSLNSNAKQHVGKGNIAGLSYSICFKSLPNYCKIELEFTFLKMIGNQHKINERAVDENPTTQLSREEYSKLLEKLRLLESFRNQSSTQSSTRKLNSYS
ncbi:uncharacterized protein B4U79_17318 [Dinothrombium tinctorium]|uniref:CUB domain-containing protein n=1 Tax=Dinothrombium tinctorium TaxID=1965070 RepID=A0A3S3SE67_9ACAR|nr:uncharacterized protein B4U79_17594 [Dinothrombium tinctorium]RWS14065.1 uncharacterized protein B4U79_17318 [Dinothrombium tinctorium]